MHRLALVLPLLLVACTTSGGPRTVAKPAGGGADDGSAAASSPAGGTLSGGTDGSPSGISGSPNGSGTQDFPLELTLGSDCGSRNQSMSATAVTEPGTKLGFVASYKKKGYVPDFTYVESTANPSGTFTWTWVLKPDTPLGGALVNLVAGKGDRGGAREERFLVAEKC